MKTVTPLLIDATNFDTLADEICQRVGAVDLVGFDIETHDDARHDGLNKIRKIDAEGFSHNNKLVFDTRRTVVTGFSLYPQGTDASFYVNIGHADVENRVPWSKARRLLDARKPGASWAIHNAPFELVMMKNALDYDVTDFICTLQMAVSAYGPDEYSKEKFYAAGLGQISVLLRNIQSQFTGFQRGQQMTTAQAEVFAQVCSKDSKAEHSYNGLVKSIAYGYGLKQAVKSWFGHEMTTYEQVVGNAPHMGELTGQQVVSYGCEDAVWCVRLYERLLQYMIETNPKVVETFFNQELPMVQVYADVYRNGLKINSKAIEQRRQKEREDYAQALRKLKAALRGFLPFPTTPHPKLVETEKWYAKNSASHRHKVQSFLNTPDVADPFEMAMQARGSVVNAWAEELGKPESQGPNLSYYMIARTIFYDLMGLKPLYYKGKLQSDAETRGELREKATPQQAAVLDIMGEIASIEQRMKLYLTPYTLLTDPETSRMYPVYSSMLASRRMATQFPNPMQLSKRNTDGHYIRGFYEADEPDHVILSLDWSQIELVEIGEFSGDPIFREHYGTLPYKDMHLVAAADAVDMDVETFRQLPTLPDSVTEVEGRKLVDKTGKQFTPKEAYKYWRTELGKGSNFNYFYSGALATVGERMGWSNDEMWRRTEKYRERFAVAEQWRLNTILEGKNNGFITLPDNHRRVRFEATMEWALVMREKWATYGDDPAIRAFADEMIRVTQTRANNQIVNSMIQGTCATIAKRSIIRIIKAIKEHGLRARFMLSIHDELLFSVHRNDLIKLLVIAKKVMSDHSDIFPTLPVTTSASVGRTFEPWHKARAPLGQIELDEAPAIDGVVPPEKIGKPLSLEEVKAVVDWLFKETKHVTV